MTEPSDFATRGGRLVAPHAMVWVRRLDAPVNAVWQAVSTLDGLREWWIVPPSRFELEVGGAFVHHWTNEVASFREREHIDFVEPYGPYAGTGGMRFELRDLGAGRTAFTFLDTWGRDVVPPGDGADNAQPGGIGTPWPGVAAGWHAMLDRLEGFVTGTSPRDDMPVLVAAYAAYLEDWYRWHATTRRTDEA